MTIIRITERVTGIEDYLTNGIKKGRSLHREELDKRVPIYGDMEVFKFANSYVQKHKDWKYNYWHITISPAWLEHDISPYTLREMVVETLGYYFHLYSRQRLAAYAEIHYPRYQSAIDPGSQEIKQRLPHVHLVVSKMDLWGDNQLRILPYKKQVAEAFQFLNNHQHLTNGMKYDPAVKQSQQIVKDYKIWHREHNEVDLESVPYAPHFFLQSPTWQPYIKPDADNERIFKRMNIAALPSQPITTKLKFDALQGFRAWLDDMATWHAEYKIQELLNHRASMAAILREANDKLGLLSEHYEIVDRSCGNHAEMVLDTRTERRYTAIYFTYKILHMDMHEAIKWLKQLDHEFDEALAEKICEVEPIKPVEDPQTSNFLMRC